MGKNKRLAINMVAQLFSFVVGLGVSFFLTPYITAKLGKDVYGFVGMAYQTTSYISVFTVAFNAMLNVFVATKYHQQDFESANEYFSSISIIDYVIGILLIIPFLLIVLFLEHLMKVPESSILDIKLLWGIIFLIFLCNLATGPWGIGLYLKNRLDLSAKRSLESNFIKAVLLLGLFCFFAPKVWFIGFASGVSSLYCVFINWKYLHIFAPELKISFRYFKWNAVKDLLSIGIWNTISQLTNIFVNGLDLLVSNIFISSLAMGYISYAQTVPIQMGSLIAMISSTFAPQLNKSFAIGKENQFIDEVKSAIKICGFICSVPVLGFIVFGRAFYSLWLPTLTIEEVNKINILSFLILFHTIFDVYIYPLYTVHGIMKKIRMPMIVSFVASVLNIILELVLLKTTDLGVYSIEIATALLMALRVLIFTPIYSAKILKQKWYKFYEPIVRGIISSGCILLIYFLIFKYVAITSWIALFIVAACAGLIGYAINYLVVLSGRDRIYVKNMIKCKIFKRG